MPRSIGIACKPAVKKLACAGCALHTQSVDLVCRSVRSHDHAAPYAQASQRGCRTARGQAGWPRNGSAHSLTSNKLAEGTF